MNEIFLTVLSLSLSGSLIAILLLFIKPIIKTRLSKTWQYYIFLIVVLRLLLPFGPDTSLMGIVFSQVETYVEVQDKSISMLKTENLFMEVVPQEKVDKKITPLIPEKKSLVSWLWLVWLIPATLLLLRKVTAYHRYTHSVKNGCSLVPDVHIQKIWGRTCGIMGIKYYPSLATNEQVASPMLIGIIHPMIVLPDTELKDTDMCYIFQHELVHYKRLDIVYKWLVQLTLCLHWFNPVVYWINREVNRNCELSCDEVVIRQFDKKRRYAYGDMLLNAIKLEKMAPDTTVSIKLSQDSKLIKERLEAIMTHKMQSRKIIVLSIMLTIFLFCGATYAGVYVVSSASKNVDILEDKGGKKASTNISPAVVIDTPIKIDEVEMRYYDEIDPNDRWPYVHWIISNNSDKTITNYEMLLLAYDKDGNPLQLIWRQLPLTNGKIVTGYTSQSDKSYEQLITLADNPILPGTKENSNGGWSLWDGWDQARGTHDVAYVLACMKQVTFIDGTVWKNPEYQDWLSEYKANSVGLGILKNFYS